MVEEPIIEEEPTLNSSAATVKAVPGSSVPGCGAGVEPWRSPCYEPYEVTIIVGEEVEWINNDSKNHTVTSGWAGDGPSGLFDSGSFLQETFVHKFETEGRFGYYCVLHPYMTGIVSIESNFSLDTPIPDWLKNMVSKWGSSINPESEFLRAIGYLIERDFILSEKIPEDYSGVQAASWIRTIAVWWGEDLITDEEFVNAMQNLIDREIIRI
jgi:plastocyanin